MRCCQDFSLTFSSRFSPRKIHWKESFGEREKFRMIGEEEEEVKDKSNKSTAQKCFSDWHDNDNIHTYPCTLTHRHHVWSLTSNFFLSFTYFCAIRAAISSSLVTPPPPPFSAIRRSFSRLLWLFWKLRNASHELFWLCPAQPCMPVASVTAMLLLLHAGWLSSPT